MREDKALLRLTPDGPTFLQIAVSAGTMLSGDVMVIGRSPCPSVSPGIRWIPDRFPASGPLGGVFTALHEASCDRCLILTCDVPFLSIDVLRLLVSRDSPADAVIPVTAASTRQGNTAAVQTLQAVYRRACLPFIEAKIVEGDLRTTSWLGAASVDLVTEDEIRALDAELLTFFSVNTPDDFRKAVSIATSCR